ncbi:hypothetical protein KR044_005127, partial [Drosophila immigrans]
MLAINTSTSETIGFTPAFVVQGREPRLPGALYDEVTAAVERRETPHYRANRLLEIFNPRPGQELQSSTSRMAAETTKSCLSETPCPIERGRGFRRQIEGPYVVRKFVSANIVRLQRVGSAQRRVANLADLKPYHSEISSGTNPDSPQCDVLNST